MHIRKIHYRRLAKKINAISTIHTYIFPPVRDPLDGSGAAPQPRSEFVEGEISVCDGVAAVVQGHTAVLALDYLRYSRLDRMHHFQNFNLKCMCVYIYNTKIY